MRIGTGWDVHRLVPGRRLVLGGVDVPSEKGALAHSDGDALLHAVIDAILGALAAGDIGKRFPDSDPAYKDADSARLLALVRDESLAGRKVANIDATIVLQRPRLGALTGAMAANIASILGLEPSRVSVKAKTAEGILGELGSGDAVAASVVLLIED